MTKFDELKQRYPNLIPVQELRSNVSIVELASHYGYETNTQKGRSRPVLEHPGYKDTIIIKNPQDAAQQIYQRAGDFTDSGTIIDFIRNRLSTVFSTFNRAGENEFRNITSVLYDYLRIDPMHVAQNRRVAAALSDEGTRQPFAKDQFDLRALESTNYLTKRNIAPETLGRPEFEGKIFGQVTYFDQAQGHTVPYPVAKEQPDQKYMLYTNVAFPYYNGLSSDIVGLELRNENLKMHAPGSERINSVFMSNQPVKPERFFIMESAIDALSHQQLRNIRGDKEFNAVYFSTGGSLTPQQVNTISRYIGSFDKAPGWTINLAFDNDTKGHRYDLQFIQQLVATKFPLTSTVGGLKHASYLLPGEAQYKPIVDKLLPRIEAYNLSLLGEIGTVDNDALGKKELAGQQFIIARGGGQVIISVPDSCGAITAMCRDLLELTGLNQRINITKAIGKDFNEDLTRQVSKGERFRYSITDETGQVIYNGHTATLMAKTMNHLKHQTEAESKHKTFHIVERQPFGFRQVQVQLKIENGQTVMLNQQPEFAKELVLEKKQRSQQTSASEGDPERKILNPESKPRLNQEPERRPDDDQPKLKR